MSAPWITSLLCQTKAQFHAKYGTESNRPFDELTIAAIIIDRPSQKLCLLKRAASAEHLPNFYELPGGSPSDEDASLAVTLIRSVKETTGLELKKILASFRYPMYYHIDKIEDFSYSRKYCVQLTWVIEVGGVDIKVDAADRHSAGAWIGEEDLKCLGSMMTVEMKKLVEAAFRWEKAAAQAMQEGRRAEKWIDTEVEEEIGVQGGGLWGGGSV